MSDTDALTQQERLNKAAVVIRRLKEKLATLESAELDRGEPIAIVGVGCRFPGGADDPAAFWALLDAGRDAIQPLAPRWALVGAQPGDEVPRWAGLLTGAVDGFDAGFFGVSPREALSLDPQQRLLLEVCWEALEDAGAGAHDGARTGVFLGACSTDYFAVAAHRPPEELDAYTVTGNLLSVAAGRLAYTFGLQGPCLTVDTACSSSLVAVHLACASLRARECDRALAGGVNLVLSPEMMGALGRTQALSPEGRCKTFDALANGYARGEGCGLVVLRRLADAVRDGDTIWAVVRGSAVNQDGRSTGLTAPNVRSQESLLREALLRARTVPEAVDFVETHGTGTALGDPIEVEALRAVFGAPRVDGSRCLLGAVKSNMGHLEAAAGVAGLIKAVLALRHERIPRNLHCRTMNPRLRIEGTALALANEPVAWPRGPRPRIAGVSAFGMSGTNAHVVLEEAPARAVEAPADPGAAALVVLSARSAEALDAAAGRLHGHLQAHPELGLGDVAVSLAARSGLSHRLAIAATSRAGLCDALAAAALGGTPPGATRGTARARGKLGFLFTGQGAQRPGMGRALHAALPVFRAAFDRCAGLFDAALARPLRAVMWAAPGDADAGLLDETVYTQPALFTLEYALFAQWSAWGVRPDLLIGHSIGELVAACVAEVMSLADAARLVAARGRLMQALPRGGAMVSIAASEAEVAAAVASHAAQVSIAAVNGPLQVVIAGAAGPVGAIAAAFAARGARTRALPVSHAFHSPLMAPMLAEFADVAATVVYRAPTRAVVSNLSGAVAGPEIATAAYWVRHAREAVRFADGVTTAHAAGVTTFVEVGPAPALLGQVTACLPDAQPTLLASLRGGRDEVAGLLEALGGAWTGGAAIDGSAVGPGGSRVALPTYPWQRQRFWIRRAEVVAARGEAAIGHATLGRRVPSAGGGAVFEAQLGLDGLAWLGDHRVAGRVVVPGAAVVEVMHAAALRAEQGAARVAEVVLQAPLVVPESGAVRVQVVVRERAVAVYGQPAESGAGAAWTLHATASLDAEVDAPARLDLAALRAACPEALDVEEVYARFAGLGLVYGPAFRGMRALWRGQGEALAELALPAGLARGDHGVHPALLDASFHAVIATLEDRAGEMLLPFAIGSVAIARPGAEVAWGLVRTAGEAGVGVTADITLADAAGEVVARVIGLRLQPASRAALQAVDGAVHRLEWREVGSPDGVIAADRRWIVVAAEGSGIAAGLVAGLGRHVRTSPSGLAAALDAEAGPAGVICAWDVDDGEHVPAAALRVASEGLAVVQALAGRAGHRLWWVTRGAVAVTPGEPVAVTAAPLWGLGRTVMQEYPELGCTLVDLAGDEGLLRELAAGDGEDQVAWRGGRRFAAWLVQVHTAAEAEDHVLRGGPGGTLGELHRVGAARRAPGPGEIEIEVRAAGLGFRDVLGALGQYPGQAPPLGGECAGVVVRVGEDVRGLAVGDSVMALGTGTFRRFVTLDARAAVTMPGGLGFAQAATIPGAFLTAWYALHDLAGLQAGERLLVHAAAGGVGMAAVQVGQALGAEVVATASAPKWEVVRGLGVRRVVNSRTPEFAAELRAADGRGVDVVLGALVGEFVDASLSLLSPGGRMIEMGKADVRDPDAVAAAHPGVRYRAFDLGEAGLDRIQAMLLAVRAAIEAGRLRPLPVRTFALADAEAAFRLMGQGKHVGRLVLVPPGGPARDGTVLVTGGLGALGLHVARWLARSGAAHLVLTGRRGAATPGAGAAVAELESLGARVTVVAVDVADRAGLAAVLADIPAELPLRGVVHAAGVLDDGVLAEQSEPRFARVFAPKVAGAWHLHALTAGAELEFFALFSSAVSVLGAAGQGNYAAANGFLDALAGHRRALGLPAHSLGWGAWAEAGLAVSLGAAQQGRLARLGVVALSPAEGVALLGEALGRPEAHLGLLRIDLRALARSFGANVPPLWRALVRPAAAAGPSAASRGAWSERLAGLPAGRRDEQVRAAVQAEVARVLGLAAGAVPVDQPLQELGLDSLMAVELRNALGERVGRSLPTTVVFDHPTVDALTRLLLAQFAAAPQVAAAAVRATDEAIAIVGIGCRFPGGIHDPESFWQVLAGEVDTITEVPRSPGCAARAGRAHRGGRRGWSAAARPSPG